MIVKTLLRFGLLAMLGVMCVGNAWAEYCWMAGCEGILGYIRVPVGQTDRARSQRVTINNESYTIDDSTLLFETPGLPEINETVVLNSSSSLASNWSPTSPIELQEACAYATDNHMKAVDYELDSTSRVAKLHEYWDDFGSGLMRKGAEVKVLGYATCEIDGEDANFALVKVVKD